MALLKRLFNRIVTLLRSNRAEHELDREVASHLALLEDDLVARGMTPEEARVAARRRLGGLDQTKERHRDARSFMWLEDLRRDIPYAIRGLVRAPGFTVAAVLTLAIGIGATTAVFSVVNAVLLQPLPYKDSDRLFRVVENRPARNPGAPPLRIMNMTRQELGDWKARTRTLSAMVGFITPPLTLMQTTDGTVRLSGVLITADLLAAFGAQPMLGRIFDEDDATRGGLVVISSSAWSRYFGSDPHIIGRTISLTTLGPNARMLDGGPMEIIGVMPNGFDFPPIDADFWAVLTTITTEQDARTPISVVARLADKVSLEEAGAEANALGNEIRPPSASQPSTLALPPGVLRFELTRLKDNLVGPVRPALRVLAVSVVIVLLIVCVNVANLLLARGTARHREIAIRLAIGSGRGRIVRQVLTESIVLATTGGGVGALLGIAGVQFVKAVATMSAPGVFRLALGDGVIPRLNEVGVDWHLMLFAIAAAVLTAALFGIAPAIHLARVNHVPTLGYRSSGATQGGARRSESRVRSALVVGQLVLATMLLVGAGLLINSFVKLSRIDPGYEPSRVLTFYLVMPEKYPTARKSAVVEDLLATLRRIPQVDAASFSYAGPLLGVVDTLGTFVPPGRTLDEMKGNPDNPFIRSISADYFKTMGVRLISGRMFDERDDAAAAPVVILNRTAATKLFGPDNPVGALVHADGRLDAAPQEVIGVVEDMRQGRINLQPTAQMFIDYRQVLPLTAARGMSPAARERLAFGFLSFAVRTNADPGSLIPAVRAAVAQVDPTAGIDAIAPLSGLVATSLTRERFYAMLLGVFAAIAALLGAIGIYGVLAYAVLQRTQEIGVRMALGAQRRQVLRLVLGRGVLLASIGIIVGIAAAAGLSRYLTGMLYGLTPLDPATYIIVATLFALVALIASYLPARRATKVDPMVALRCE